jgi:tetratricopeptide (TPR) repeat protein
MAHDPISAVDPEDSAPSTPPPIPESARRTATPAATNEAFREAARVLAADLREEAERAGERGEGGLLWCCAGELLELGTGDLDEALTCYSRASEHPTRPAAAFAGLRRLARREGDSESVGALYAQEAEQGADSAQITRALCQQAAWVLRQRNPRGWKPLEKRLRSLEGSDAWSTLLAFTVRQDLALRGQAYEQAAEVQVGHFELANTLASEESWADRVELAELAAAAGLTHRYLTGRQDEASYWLERSFSLKPSRGVLGEWASIGWMEQAPEEYAAHLDALAADTASPTERARALFELAMVRAHRLQDPSGARAALRRGMAAADVGAPCAPVFVSLAESDPDAVPSETVIDALGIQAEHAATPAERADALYRMALVFDRDMTRPDAAIELLREAVEADPEHRPARKALSRIYQRAGSWELLAELLEAEVERHPEDFRTQMKLAEVYQDRLNEPLRAEPHLQRLLAEQYYPPAAERMARVLYQQARWRDLYEHYLRCAELEGDLREQLYLIERAAQLAEYTLERPHDAVRCWQRIHEIDPLHPGCLAALRRLHFQLESWEALIQLNEDELATRDEPEAGARLWSESGALYEQRLGDEERAQQCYELALELVPTYPPALEGLGRILWRNRDWEALVDMHEAEIAATTDAKRVHRCLLDLGEFQAEVAGRPRDALRTFQRILEAEAYCEEALLWIERLHLRLGETAQALDALERRMVKVETRSLAPLSLRAASLAEWAIAEPQRAWNHYLAAVPNETTRGLAIAGMTRLWSKLRDDEASLALGVEAVQRHLDAELEPDVRADMLVLVRRIKRGARALDDAAALLPQRPDGVAERAAHVLGAAVAGDAEALCEHRASRRLGALWSLAASLDGERGATLPSAELPATGLAGDLVSEGGLDHTAVGAPLAALGASPVDFRAMVRAWRAGEAVPRPATEAPSIPALRLSTHAALDAGDTVAASRFSEREAGSWSSASAVQRRLTLAAELRHDAARDEARELFQRALDTGCYEHPSRINLYQALERCDELELLIEGLETHVLHTGERDAKVPWWRRLAVANERISNRNGALAAWSHILDVLPDDLRAIREKTRLLTVEGLYDEARGLLARSLRYGFEPSDKLDLLSQLADLHLMEGGDGAKAVEALESAVELSQRDADWMRRLARAHFAFGRADRAVSLLVEALPSTATHADLPDWLLMARCKYLRLEDKDGGRELLWSLFEQFPEDTTVLRELEGFYRRNGGAAELAERISTMLVDPPFELSETVRAFLWEYVGDLNYQVLRRNRDAEVAFAAALQAGGDACRLSFRVARALGQQPGKGREALERFAEALRHPEVGVGEWLEAIGDLEALFDGVEDPARVRIIRQISDLLRGERAPAREEARLKRDPARRIETQLGLEKLADGLVGPASLAAIQALAPTLERCFGERRPRRRALGGKRLKASEMPVFIDLVELAGDTLSVATPRIYTGEGGCEHPDWLAGDGLFVPRELLQDGDEGALRFWAGHAAASMAFELSPLALAEPGEIEAVLTEVRRIAQGGEPGVGWLKEVASSRLASGREGVMAAWERDARLLERVTEERWRDLPVYVADRFGLLLCGDVRAAVGAVMSLEGDIRPGDRAERIVRSKRACWLLEYALSFAYQELRYLAGLAARPRVL